METWQLIFNCAATVMFAFLCFLWASNNTLNTSIKTLLFTMALCAAFLSYYGMTHG